MVCFDQPLVQFIFLLNEFVDEFLHVPAAGLLVPLHLAESAFVLSEHEADLVLAGADPLDIRDDRVPDHLRILPEAQRAEGLLELPGRRSNAQHDRRARAPAQRRPKDLRQRRVPVWNVRVC